MTYQISTAPTGARLWWLPEAEIPADHSDIRPATRDEAVLMGAIVRQDAAGEAREADLCRALRVLMGRG